MPTVPGDIPSEPPADAGIYFLMKKYQAPSAAAPRPR